MRDLVVVTIVTSNYLHYARALHESVVAAAGDVEFITVLVDRARWVEPVREPFPIVFADELGIPSWERFAFQYGAFDLSCALKPHALSHLLNRRASEAGKVVYLDSDVQVYGSLDPIDRRLESSSIVLSPHLSAPLPDDGKAPSELGLRRAGAYNGGFVAVRDGEDARAFLRWWSEKLRQQCINDPDVGLVVDQSWLDLVPGLFAGVYVERDPEFNVAYWNLPARNLTLGESGRPSVNGRPLRFFHFSGFQPLTPDRLSVYQDRLSPNTAPVLRDLLRAYAKRLDSAGRAACEQATYAFDALSDGTPIKHVWREAVRLGHPLLADVADPFDVRRFPDVKERLRAAEEDPRCCEYPDRLARTRTSLFSAPLEGAPARAVPRAARTAELGRRAGEFAEAEAREADRETWPDGEHRPQLGVPKTSVSITMGGAGPGEEEVQRRLEEAMRRRRDMAAGASHDIGPSARERLWLERDALIGALNTLEQLIARSRVPEDGSPGIKERIYRVLRRVIERAVRRHLDQQRDVNLALLSTCRRTAALLDSQRSDLREQIELMTRRQRVSSGGGPSLRY